MLPLCALGALAAATLPLLAPAQELRAAEFLGFGDADRDGLSDQQELVLQSSPVEVDTDGDGYGDAEELARGSDLQSASSTPLPAELDMALIARGEAGALRVSLAVYFTDGTTENKQLEFGALIDETIVPLPQSSLLSDARMSVRPTLDGLGDVLVVDFELPWHAVLQLGRVSLFSTLSIEGSGSVSAAAVVDFLVTGDEVLVQRAPAWPSSLGGRGDGGFYQPIPPSGDYPLGWEPGRICYQVTEPVALSGGVLTTRVESAECIDGWDSYCNEVECKASIGDEYTSIDPVGLVGG